MGSKWSKPAQAEGRKHFRTCQPAIPPCPIFSLHLSCRLPRVLRLPCAERFPTASVWRRGENDPTKQRKLLPSPKGQVLESPSRSLLLNRKEEDLGPTASEGPATSEALPGSAHLRSKMFPQSLESRAAKHAGFLIQWEQEGCLHF